MRWVGRIGIAVGVAGIVLAAVTALWPLHANGVSGSALRPHYARYFGFVAYGPLPARPTDDDLRHLGVRFPQDAVRDRRFDVYAIFASAVLLTVCGAAVSAAGTDRRRASLATVRS